jgi:uncharacterized protein with FMN-binding domain
VVAVYAAGFYRTKAAADRLADADAHRRRPDGVPFDPIAAAPPSQTAPRLQPTTGAVVAPPQTPPVTFSLPTRPAPDRGAIAPQTPSPRNHPETPAATVTTAATVTATPAEDVAPALPVESAAIPAQTGTVTAASLEQPATTPGPAKPSAQYKDGTYLGWGSCRHGDIQASVTIVSGRIAEAKIAQCWTRYSCSWIDSIVPQVAARQSPNVDYVSGATQSVDAFYWAVVDALSKAK